MPLSKHIILGVHITDRLQQVESVQRLLTEYGCSIRTRLGLHEANDGSCSPNGLLILEMTDDEKSADQLAAKLNAVKGVEVKKLVFDHPAANKKS
ncbi:MAG TPA: hypothetical protein PLX18_03095 [Anaerohalosphaeraceae bacterium]|jgi:hypothetical protein|nr:hypothetical protein [Anaerohalosphaeraceae bacterium]HOT72046.1 hypothetical protein [Anaerohalosphaeraceae bacterium]HPB92845.1 hypothetical protein [Anaerohalosphaeraceae bacterium]HQG05464.1 hypothetical protein [Anaerohalosphaeraceae bacterium]HQI06837.1 hypothetical protein [Anaerohalosphaeraceae bacterium]